MASITRQSNGRREIQFVGSDGKRRTIRLGKCEQRVADGVKIHIEHLAASAASGQGLAIDTARWLKTIGDGLHGRLASAGLCDPRQPPRAVGDFIDDYLARKKAELKPSSLRKLKLTGDTLKASLGAAAVLTRVTRDMATAWRKSLADAGMSEATAKVNTGNAKQIMRAAVDAKLIEENPFAHLRSGSTASKYVLYVDPKTFAGFLDQLPNDEWRLMFALARFAGLRVPSESHLLTWADVDWEKGRLNVRSPKTERHAGHESRLVPIDPRLMTILRRHFDAAEEGSTHLVRITGNGYIADRFEKACTAANVGKWERPFQTLRSSCEKEWAMKFPQYAVSCWIGHSLVVSGRHYANAVPDELFARAAGPVPTSVQGDVKSDAAAGRITSHDAAAKEAAPLILAVKANSHDSLRSRASALQVAGEGFEPTTFGL